jgi:hypothetical protein
MNRKGRKGGAEDTEKQFLEHDENEVINYVFSSSFTFYLLFTTLVNCILDKNDNFYTVRPVLINFFRLNT